MVTVDLRTRFENDQINLDPATFLTTDAPRLVEVHGEAAGRAAARLELPPLTFDVEGDRLSFAVDGARLVVASGGPDTVVVSLDRLAFSDLMQDVVSTFGAQMTGRAVVAGNVDAFVEWEPVLRCLLDGRPVYEPGTIMFHGPAGGPLDLQRVFTLDDEHAEIAHFLAEAGYLHLAGVFTDIEMAAVSAELDDAVAMAERDDGASWWARTDEGEWYAARILGFNQRSPALREILHTDRFRMIGGLTDDEFLQREPDRGDSAEGLLKKVGVVEGISDVSWHKDCAMGNHSRNCCGLIVGISVTGAGPTNGELGAVAGSHRANIAALGVDGLDLPRVALPTRAGDVTVHCSCTLHMSRPPVSAERRVVYTGFNLAPRPGDRRVERSADEIRRDRASLNDHVRRQQADLAPSSRLASHEL
jgi:hypothetical protein